MRSLRSKLILAFLVVSLIVLAMVVAFARWSTSTEFRQYVLDRNQENFVSSLGNYYSQEKSWRGVGQVIPRGPMPFGMMSPQAMPAGEIVLVDADFNILIGGRGTRPGQRISHEQLRDALPVEVDGAIVGFVLLRRDAFREQPNEAAFLQRLTQSLLLGSLAVIALALILGLILARSLTNPLRQLTSATRRVAAGDLEFKLDISSQDELGELAQSFNMMNQRLAQLRDDRRQMTADIAHELRTPVSVILGYADGLKEKVIHPSQETFDLIQEQAEQLEHLIEDLRILTQAEAGELSIDIAATDPLPLVERAMAAFEHQAARQGITLTVAPEGESPAIMVDPDRFRQVLANLISNALQNTPSGGQITTRVTSDEKRVLISVIDTGPGIPPENIDRIFQRFFRLDPSRSRDTGGSGLGLSIARSLVERQGGQIEVESELGQGACFTISFPRQTPS
jgi:signal transduction histidine kinase